MSHREEPEEAGLRGPPPHRSKQPNGTPLEGGRPRWRPCQLHNPDAEGQGHHHHHQANLHTSGSSRGPPRHRRRHAPGEAQRRRAESGDTEARAGQQPKPGASRHHRSGERLHQHRYRQQHKEEEEEQVVKTPPKEQASEPLSPEDSSQEPLTPSPQDEPFTDGLDANSPDLSHSSDTHIDRDPEPESSVEHLEEKVQSEESKLGEEELVKENQEKDYFRETPEQDYAPPKIASKSRPERKRTSPLRVDVPPFATSPRQMMNKPFFQSPRTFPETLRSHHSDPKSYPAHFNTGYAHTSKDKEFESPMFHVEDHQEDLSDSSPEACTDSYPRLSPDCHPEESPTEYQTESNLTDPPPALEGPQTYERHQSVTTEEYDPQEDIDQRSSVGSRLHHYDEQSGDEAESSGRVRAQVRKTSSSTSLSQEAPTQEETSETAQLSPDLQVEVVERPDKTSTPAQDQMTESCRATGDAVSLAIKDIKEAIEEVKTKAVRSPYTPDKITEPVWVMRQDVSPVEENPPQLQPQVHSHPQSPCQLSQSSPQYAVSELSDVSPSVPSLMFCCVSTVPGPCDPDDLIDGIIFAANYLGSTQLLSERTPTKSGRMQQAQEAMSRVRVSSTRVQTGDTQLDTEVDLFISTQRIKVLSAYTQVHITGIILSHFDQMFGSSKNQTVRLHFGSQREYSDLLNTQDMYNDDLIHFSKSENCRDVYIEKQKGEILGVVIVESGWGSILPTVIIASLMHGAPAAKSGRLNIGDQIMTVNGTSLVGLPLSTCQSIIKGLKAQSRIKMNIVRCPPVTMVLIRRPDLRYQLGFSVQNGIICSLMRGGIAERGGVRVGHRIIEINGQSVVATAHEKIVHILSNAVGEIHMKTMPAAMYRLLTAQEQPVYI
uniref:Amyloid beta (A4) precursor protein-binding, family A, member 1b n=1 Tax=Cyprinus carpio TaxID=7962 RepID=A0A8C2G2P9_CYPCA